MCAPHLCTGAIDRYLLAVSGPLTVPLKVAPNRTAWLEVGQFSLLMATDAQSCSTNFETPNSMQHISQKYAGSTTGPTSASILFSCEDPRVSSKYIDQSGLGPSPGLGQFPKLDRVCFQSWTSAMDCTLT